jgi:hypothetical protein
MPWRKKIMLFDLTKKFLNEKEYEKRTELCEIMQKHGSDKGFGRHNYTTFYDKIFSDFRNDVIDFFEIGIGSIDPHIESNMSYMGSKYQPGASLHGWCEYFPKGKIYGADVDYASLFYSDRIETFYCDQRNEQTFIDMWQLAPIKDIQFDVIIEDGLHTIEANVNAFNWSFHKVKLGGFYIIEDILGSNANEYIGMLEHIAKFNNEVCLFEIPCKENDSDNLLMVIKKGMQ